MKQQQEAAGPFSTKSITTYKTSPLVILQTREIKTMTPSNFSFQAFPLLKSDWIGSYGYRSNPVSQPEQFPHYHTDLLVPSSTPCFSCLEQFKNFAIEQDYGFQIDANRTEARPRSQISRVIISNRDLGFQKPPRNQCCRTRIESHHRTKQVPATARVSVCRRAMKRQS